MKRSKKCDISLRILCMHLRKTAIVLLLMRLQNQEMKRDGTTNDDAWKRDGWKRKTNQTKNDADTKRMSQFLLSPNIPE